MDRRAQWLAILGAAIFLLLALVGWKSLVIVPQHDGNLRETRQILRQAGLDSVVARQSAALAGIGISDVVGQTPAAGRVALRGSAVTLTLVAPQDEVVVPDLIGRFGADASRALDRVGLATPAAGPGDELIVVYSQEPDAGTILPFGSPVRFRALFPHTQEASTVAPVKAVHGIFYLRYGIEGSKPCSPCHSANTCIGAKCHAGTAYRDLERMTPDPH